LSSALPDLLVEAHRIAATVASGWHGRRQAGPGETFWQFRPFTAGEAVTRIDWRKSARDDHLQVREREWESAHTIWLWPDLSGSMDFRSSLSPITKRDRALVLLLATADLLARGGERVGIPGVLRPTPDRRAAERAANAFVLFETESALPDAAPIRRFQDVIIVGDFLDDIDELTAKLSTIAASGARGHMVQVLDPSEETFPFTGRTEFRDPESGLLITAGRAERWATAYKARFQAHREALRQLATRLGWSLLVHHTDRPASEPLLALHARLSTSARGSLNARATGGPRTEAMG
jgi:uncharacterized protein (DUF58 family)